VDGSVLFWPMVLQGLGMGFLFVPNSTLGFATIPRNLTTEAAGLYSMVRTIGSAVGIAVASAWLSHMNGVNWAEMRAAATPFNTHANGYLGHLHLDLHGLGAQVLSGVIQEQASVNAFVNTFWLITASFVAMFPLLLLIKPIPKGVGAAPAAVMHE
jgi:DHA2 family multidrug resistance protein